MPRFVTATVSRDILVDELTHTVTILRCLEIIRVPDFPATLPPFFVTTFWTRETEKEQLQLRVRILTPEETSCFEKTTGLESFEKALRFRFFIRITDFTCTAPGEYHIEIAMRTREKGRWKKVARLPITIQRFPGEYRSRR